MDHGMDRLHDSDPSPVTASTDMKDRLDLSDTGEEEYWYYFLVVQVRVFVK